MIFFYTPSFVRAFDDLEEDLKNEVCERIEQFKKNQRDPSLKTHKLQGRMEGKFSFSVNYQYRIIFCYDARDSIAFLMVGTHDIYQ